MLMIEVFVMIMKDHKEKKVTSVQILVTRKQNALGKPSTKAAEHDT